MAVPLSPGYQYSGQARQRLSYAQVKQLAQAFGLPGDAMAQIAMGESSLYADIQQRDPGDGMVGYGLLQMTPNSWGKGSPAYRYMQSLGGIDAMRDPVKNMQMARYLYQAAGNKLTPWRGTSFLTNRSGEGRLGPVNQSLIPSGLGKAGAGGSATATTASPSSSGASSSDGGGQGLAQRLAAGAPRVALIIALFAGGLALAYVGLRDTTGAARSA